MENMVFDSGREGESDEISKEELLESGGISSQEEAFMRGYSEDEETIICDECGMAIRKKPVTKEIDGEKYKFCCEACAKEFKENMG